MKYKCKYHAIARSPLFSGLAAIFALSLAGCADEGIFGNCSPDDPRTWEPTTFSVKILAKGGLGYHPLPTDAVDTGDGCGASICKETAEMSTDCIGWKATMSLADDSVCRITVSLAGKDQVFENRPKEVCGTTIAGSLSLVCCDDACGSVGIYGEDTCP